MHLFRSSLLALALTLPVHAFAQSSDAVARIVERAAMGRVLLVGEIHGTAEAPMAVADLAQQMAVKAREVTRVLMKMGEVVTQNQPVDQATAALVVNQRNS